jgi:hypothetical protein
MSEEPRYQIVVTGMDENNDKDLVKFMKKGELFPITDEEDGGIIAYVIGEEHALRIQKALTLSDRLE